MTTEMMTIPLSLAWALVSTNTGIRETAQIELRQLLRKERRQQTQNRPPRWNTELNAATTT
jgi:hypothetical protein